VVSTQEGFVSVLFLCFSITLITVFTHISFYTEKRNPPNRLVSGKFYFQPSLKSGPLLTPLEKQKRTWATTRRRLLSLRGVLGL
jgi:hypothetical protein